MRSRVLPLLFCCCFAGQAQWPANGFHSEPEAEDLASRYDRVAWPSPESIAGDLRSDNNETRFKALGLLGLPAESARQQGKWVPMPDEIELRYVALGEDKTLDAFVAVAINSDMTFAAVAVPRDKGWVRVGAFQCWCKYSRNLLEEFIAVRSTIEPNKIWPELVIHASGGGTGAYEQQEIHFRVHQDGLRRVLAFENRSYECPPIAANNCDTAERWLLDNVLVQRIQAQPHAASTTCTTYQWDEKAFLYRPLGPPTKCAKPLPPP